MVEPLTPGHGQVRRLSWLRSYGIIGVLGLGVLATTALSVLAGWGGTVIGGAAQFVFAALSLAISVGLFWLGFHLATASEVSWRDQWLGALLAGVVWQTLQLVGGYIVAHQLQHSSSLYGVFGIVLGLLVWLSLQATLTLYAVEADVVRVKRLWPRSLFPPPLAPEDEKAYRAYAQTERRME